MLRAALRGERLAVVSAATLFLGATLLLGRRHLERAAKRILQVEGDA